MFGLVSTCVQGSRLIEKNGPQARSYRKQQGKRGVEVRSSTATKRSLTNTKERVIVLGILSDLYILIETKFLFVPTHVVHAGTGSIPLCLALSCRCVVLERCTTI